MTLPHRQGAYQEVIKHMKNHKSIKVETMKSVDFSELKLPMIVVYDKPEDFPDKIIARVWDSSIPAPTNIYAEYENLKECRKDISSTGLLTKIPRSENDVASILESYI